MCYECDRREELMEPEEYEGQDEVEFVVGIDWNTLTADSDSSMPSVVPTERKDTMQAKNVKELAKMVHEAHKRIYEALDPDIYIPTWDESSPKLHQWQIAGVKLRRSKDWESIEDFYDTWREEIVPMYDFPEVMEPIDEKMVGAIFTLGALPVEEEK